jgi:hypothetical protein
MVWLRNRRRIPVAKHGTLSSHSECLVVYEVLVVDACVLRRIQSGGPVTGEYASEPSLSCPSSRNVGVHGVVRAKSPDESGGSSKPAFIVELVDAAEMY